MKRGTVVAVVATLAACAGAPPSAGPRYPVPPTSDVVDDYFGTKVADPYRPLEAIDSPPTRAWVAAENELSESVLHALPERAAIRERLSQLWSYERFGGPVRLPSGAILYQHSRALQNQPVLYIRDRDDAEPRVLIDPNAWSSDATGSMADWRVSPDGRHIAYAVQSSGSDWVQYRVFDLAKGETLPDRIEGVNFNFDFSRIFWRGGNSGFFYSRFPAPPLSAGAGAPPEVAHQKLYWHRLGTRQDQDVLVYERPDLPHGFVWGEVTDDGRYLVIYVEKNEDTEKELYVKDLADPEHPRLDAPARPIMTGFDARYYLAGNVGPLLYLRTSKDAPRFRIVALDLRKPRAGLREVVPQSADALQDAHIQHGQLVLSYLHDAASRIARYSLRGAPLGDLPLPGLGSAAIGRASPASPELYFGFTSFSQPYEVFRADLATGATTPVFTPAVAFKPDDYVTEQVFYPSKDGTKIPLFLTRRKDLPRDKPAPTLLYGYGGFSIAQTPGFSVPDLVWMERGGVYAQACLRGGSEYGEAWHEAGMLARKQNVFDDFIAAAEYLVRSGVTTPAQLAIKGRSNGGLLIGAVVDQRPDLFAAANAAVGVLDMLRYHQFGIAYAWAGDYGRSDDPKMFPVLRAYSPVHNVRPGVRYPAVLITTADHDDRVHPLHSYKYAAALQAAQAGDRPILIRVETRAGHASGGAGTPLSKQIEENADILAFLRRYTQAAK